jgi:DNA end-binding protein Ku
MSARAMWKGVLRIGDASVPVKLYSALESHDIHFRMLHAKDLTPVAQALVNPDTDEVVSFEQTRRGYVASDGEMVILQSDELAALAPKESRHITLSRFVPTDVVDPQWYDRPYYLGPDRSENAYAALTEALGRSELEGVAHWVMRKKAYVGALRVHDGHLALISLRHAGEVVPIETLELPSGPDLDKKELDMAKQLMGMLEADFDPTEYRDEYRDQLVALIESKKRGKKPNLKVVAPKARTDDLTAALTASLRAHRPAAAGRKAKAKGKTKTENSRASA